MLNFVKPKMRLAGLTDWGRPYFRTAMERIHACAYVDALAPRPGQFFPTERGLVGGVKADFMSLSPEMHTREQRLAKWRERQPPLSLRERCARMRRVLAVTALLAVAVSAQQWPDGLTTLVVFEPHQDNTLACVGVSLPPAQPSWRCAWVGPRDARTRIHWDWLTPARYRIEACVVRVSRERALGPGPKTTRRLCATART